MLAEEPQPNDALLGELIDQERALHSSPGRHDPATLSSLLADEFREFGSSGRVYDKSTTIAMLVEETAAAPIAATDFRLAPLAAGCALLTYQASRDNIVSLRSSLWIYRDHRWQMLFHQGTRVPAKPVADHPGPGDEKMDKESSPS